jgi:hypothetical protein
VAPREPIRIYFPKEIRILECTTLRVTDVSNNFQATPDIENSVLVQFDFLNQKDGALVQVLHSGASEDETEIEGQLIGPRPDIEYTSDSKFLAHGLEGNDLTVFGRGMRILSSIWVLLVGIALLFAVWSESSWIALTIGILYLLIGIWTIIPSRSRIPKKLRTPEVAEAS